jgi:hypothetical protein
VPYTPARPLDLSAVHPQNAREGAAPDRQQEPPNAAGVAPADTDWKGEAERLRAALQDVVTLSEANAQPSQRLIQMKRRASAALAGLDTRGR